MRDIGKVERSLKNVRSLAAKLAMSSFVKRFRRLRVYQVSLITLLFAVLIGWVTGYIEKGFIISIAMTLSFVPINLFYGCMRFSEFSQLEERYAGLKLFYYPPILLSPSYLLAEYLILMLGVFG